MASLNDLKPADRLADVGEPSDTFKNPGQSNFLRGLIVALRRNFTDFIGRDTAAPYFHLLSVGGKVYRITVADNGTVTSTYIRG